MAVLVRKSIGLSVTTALAVLTFAERLGEFAQDPFAKIDNAGKGLMTNAEGR